MKKMSQNSGTTVSGCKQCINGFSNTEECKKHMENCHSITKGQFSSQKSPAASTESKSPAKSTEDIRPSSARINSRTTRQLKLKESNNKVEEKPTKAVQPNKTSPKTTPTKDTSKVSPKTTSKASPVKPSPSKVIVNKNVSNKSVSVKTNVNKVGPNKSIPNKNALNKTSQKKKAIDGNKIAIRVYNDDENPYKCSLPLCLCQFKTRAHLEYHLKCHNVADNNYKCPECSELFYIWRSLRVHLRKVHEIEIEVYSCEYCGENFDFKYRLIDHKQVHSWEYPFVCESCGKTFDQYQDWCAHEATHRIPIKKNWKCNVCSQAFSKKKSLAFHKRTRHGEGRPHVCNNCGYAAKSDAVLKEHVCDGEKWFKCEQCLYCTWNYKLFHRHTMKHSGVRQFRCSQCLCIHQDLKSYLQHFTELHPGEIIVMICPLCPFTSGDSTEFHNHINDHQRGLDLEDANEDLLQTQTEFDFQTEDKNIIDSEQNKIGQSLSSAQNLNNDYEIVVVQEVDASSVNNINSLTENINSKKIDSSAISNIIPQPASLAKLNNSLNQCSSTPPPPTLPPVSPSPPPEPQICPVISLNQTSPPPPILSPSAPFSTLPSTSNFNRIVPDASQRYIIQPNPETGVWSLVPVNQLVML